jgi:TrwC relaxase/AAA domain
MAYYAKSGEPPGQWHGKGTGVLGLSGKVDPDVIQSLYMKNTAPTGEMLAKSPKQDDGTRDVAVARAVHAYRRQHPYASAVELDGVRAKARAKGRKTSVPYFDQTISMVKSASVVHASYRVGAMQERQAGNDEVAAKLDARADDIERALMDASREAVDWLEQHATYTRTGYHSEMTGEWRDAAGGPMNRGLTTSLFLHHLSRDGDPHLHVHVAIWNRVQRADGADDKYRTLYGRALFRQRLGLQPVADRFAEKRLREMGFVMVPRADGNGCEIGGVSEKVMRKFSSRAVAIGPELARLVEQWKQAHGGQEPNKRTLWLLHQQAAQNTRRTKAQSRRTVGGKVGVAQLTEEERLAAWEAQTTADEMADLSLVWQEAEQFARDHAPPQQGRARTGAAPAADVQPAVLPPVPDRVLSDAEKDKAARIAVAEVQQRHSTWGMAELRFEIHRALGAAVSEADVAEIAAAVISARTGAGVVQVGAAPDVTDVSELGVRESDGVSVYRPPLEERWCTVDHLDLEQHIVETARAKMPQLVSRERAWDAVLRTDLTPDQANAVVALLTGDTMTTPLNAAAGSGKSHTMAVYSRLWTELTGARVVGLATSTNAAEVLAGEGLPESYNIAQFLGKVKDSDKLRYPVRIGPGDVLVVDEATQASTADFALVQQAARQAGAFLHPVGDTNQLGSVDAGGIFSLLVADLGGPRMDEILRFEHEWEAAAAGQLARGDIAAVAAYQRRGGIYGADRETTFDQAATLSLADRLAGKDGLLVVGSNAEAADLSRRVQAKRVEIGEVGPGEVELADQNMAGVGDLIRARLNTKIDAGGRELTNRDRLRVTAVGDDHIWARRQTAPGAWSDAFQVPVKYLNTDAELDYAGNVHVAEGRTVDVGRAVITETMSRPSQYVAMTRGREENFAHVVTGNTAPAGKKPCEQATVEQVIKSVMERDGSELSATEQMRAAQEWSGGAGHVLHLWSTAVRRDLYPAIDRQIAAALTPEQARRYAKEYAREPLHARLREAQLAGHDLDELISRITTEDLGGARSVSSVLHSRLEGLGLDQQFDAAWAQRTPSGASQLARELAEGLDARTRELGERAAADVQPWLANRLGVLAPDASPALRAEYERRAGIAAGYREAAGITYPDKDIAPDPHEGNPELETWRKATMRALEIPDDAEVMRAMTRGQLEAHVAKADRAIGTVPAQPSEQLRQTGQAKAGAQAQGAEARVRGDAQAVHDAEQLAAGHAERETELEKQMQAYEKWSQGTAATRELGGKARAELDRRGYEPLPPEYDGSRTPSGDLDLAAWWRQFEADVDQVEKAIDRERQAALDEGRPWPPERQPQDEAAADVAESDAQAGDDTRADLKPAPTEIEDPPDLEAGQKPCDTPGAPRAAGTASPRGAQPPPSPPAPEPPAEPEPPTEVGAGAGTSNKTGPSVVPPEPEPGDWVEALNTRVDELTSRAAEVTAERAEQEASTDAYLQARREAEIEAPEPAAEVAGDYEPEA